MPVSHVLTGTIDVAGHLISTPWLEYRVPQRGWMSQVREAIEDPWEFVSADLDVVVAVLEAEYRYEALVGANPFRGPGRCQSRVDLAGVDAGHGGATMSGGGATGAT